MQRKVLLRIVVHGKLCPSQHCLCRAGKSTQQCEVNMQYSLAGYTCSGPQPIPRNLFRGP